MKLRWLTALAAVALWRPAEAAAPLEVYGQLPDISDVAVSPDGGKVAYITHVGGKDGVIAVSLQPTAQLFGGNFEDAKLRGILWADPTHLLVIKSVTKRPAFVNGDVAEWNILLSVDLVTRLLEGVPANSMNVIEARPSLAPSPAAR